MGLEEVACACLWSSRWRQQFAPSPRAPVGGVLLPRSVYSIRNSFGGPASLLVHFPRMVSCLSGGPRLLPSTPPVAVAQPLQALPVPNHGPLSGTELQSLSFST